MLLVNEYNLDLVIEEDEEDEKDVFFEVMKLKFCLSFYIEWLYLYI